MPDRHGPAAPFTARSAYTRGEISREAAARPPVRFSYGPGTDLASYRPPAGARLARPGVVVQRGGAPGPSVVHPGRRDPSRRDPRRRRGQGTGRGNRLRSRRGGHRSRRRHVRGALVDRGWPGLLRGRLVLPGPGGRTRSSVRTARNRWNDRSSPATTGGPPASYGRPPRWSSRSGCPVLSPACSARASRDSRCACPGELKEQPVSSRTATPSEAATRTRVDRTSS